MKKKIVKNGKYLYFKINNKIMAGYNLETGKFWGATIHKRDFEEWIEGNTMFKGMGTIK